MPHGIGHLTSAFIALSLAFSTCSVFAQTTKPVLGIVDPGKTTLAQFEYALREKDCKFESAHQLDKLPIAITVHSECFDLPGSPTIEAAAEAEDSPIEVLKLMFKDKDDESFFQLYSNALERSYGQPQRTLKESGSLVAMWRMPQRRLVVELSANRESHVNTLIYSMGIQAKDILDNYGDLKPVPKTGKDLGNL